MKPFILCFAWVGILAFGSGTGWTGPADLVETVGNGEINWSQGIIVARGSGAPPPEARNIAQARLMTERAALVDARRNLLEILKGVRVDSTTLVENFMVMDDQVRLQAEGFIQGSVELRSLRRYLSDGAIEVTVAMNLSGDFLSILLLAGAESKKAPEKPSPLSAEPQPDKKELPSGPPPPVKEAQPTPPPVMPAPENKPETPLAAAPEKTFPNPVDLPRYTGVVIDARGLAMKPALIPRILDGKGQELYRGGYVPPEKAAQNGLALFCRDLTAAQTNPRVGKNPLTVKGLKVTPGNPADIILGEGEAKKLAPFAQQGTFLEDCKVMIVLD